MSHPYKTEMSDGNPGTCSGLLHSSPAPATRLATCLKKKKNSGCRNDRAFPAASGSEAFTARFGGGATRPLRPGSPEPGQAGREGGRRERTGPVSGPACRGKLGPEGSASPRSGPAAGCATTCPLRLRARGLTAAPSGRAGTRGRPPQPPNRRDAPLT